MAKWHKHRPARSSAQRAVLDAIAFYEQQGWDWLGVVEYLAWRGAR